MGFSDQYGYDPAAHPDQVARNKALIQHTPDGKAYILDPWGQKKYRNWLSMRASST